MNNKLLHLHEPVVSIVLCTYNRSSYLPLCIESVLNQSFQSWELIIVDDGSIDETFHVVNPYIHQYSQIKYIKHSNRRLGLSRNVGLQSSMGHYITFIDSDDVYKPEHISARVAFMETNPAIDILTGGVQIDEDIWVQDFFYPDQLIHIRDCVLGSTFFGKRPVFFALNGFKDIAYGEDTEFWFRAERMFRTQKISQPETYVYHRAEDSISRRMTQR